MNMLCYAAGVVISMQQMQVMAEAELVVKWMWQQSTRSSGNEGQLNSKTESNSCDLTVL